MDSKVVTFLSPSKATIADIDTGRFCVVTVGRTGHPVTKSYLRMASSKMEAVNDYENELAEYKNPSHHVRIRSIDIDNKHSYSAMISVDLIVGHNLPPADVEILKKQTEEDLSPILSIDLTDKFGATYYLELSVHQALLSSDSFHPNMDSYYEKFL